MCTHKTRHKIGGAVQEISLLFLVKRGYNYEKVTLELTKLFRFF